MNQTAEPLAGVKVGDVLLESYRTGHTVRVNVVKRTRRYIYVKTIDKAIWTDVPQARKFHANDGHGADMRTVGNRLYVPEPGHLRELNSEAAKRRLEDREFRKLSATPAFKAARRISQAFQRPEQAVLKAYGPARIIAAWKALEG